MPQPVFRRAGGRLVVLSALRIASRQHTKQASIARAGGIRSARGAAVSSEPCPRHKHAGQAPASRASHTGKDNHEKSLRQSQNALPARRRRPTPPVRQVRQIEPIERLRLRHNRTNQTTICGAGVGVNPATREHEGVVVFRVASAWPPPASRNFNFFRDPLPTRRPGQLQAPAGPVQSAGGVARNSRPSGQGPQPANPTPRPRCLAPMRRGKIVFTFSCFSPARKQTSVGFFGSNASRGSRPRAESGSRPKPRKKRGPPRRNRSPAAARHLKKNP